MRLVNYLSFDIGGTNLRRALVSDEGVVLTLDKCRTPDSFTELAKLISTFTTEMRGKYVVSREIGVSVAGLFDRKANCVLFPNAFDGRSVDVNELFSDLAGFSINISDDRTAGIYGEKWVGAGRGHDEFVYLIIGTGVGLGIMKGHAVLSGADGVAGSVGWIKRGGTSLTFEECIAGPGIEKRYAALSGEWMGARQIFESPESLAKLIVKETGKMLGELLAIVVNSLNPELVILGGSVGEQWSTLREPALPIFFKSISSYINTNTIVVSELSDKAPILGNVGKILNFDDER